MWKGKYIWKTELALLLCNTPDAKAGCGARNLTNAPRCRRRNPSAIPTAPESYSSLSRSKAPNIAPLPYPKLPGKMKLNCQILVVSYNDAKHRKPYHIAFVCVVIAALR